MIHVARPVSPADVPESLRPGNLGYDKERREAQKHYGSMAKVAGSFSFKVYKSPDVIEALLDLFSRKCAYCESILKTQPPDLEHYRPKGAVMVDGKLVTPGYYWLAAEWTNLLPSCIDCNRERFTQKKVKSGKANHFPLADPKKRWRHPGKPNREEPLLLDPCSDDPGLHLVFDPAREGAVSPAVHGSGDDPKGVATIAVFGLNRPALAQSRKGYLTRLRFVISQYEKARARLAANPGNKEASEDLAEALAELGSIREDAGQEHLGMCRQIIDRLSLFEIANHPAAL